MAEPETSTRFEINCINSTRLGTERLRVDRGKLGVNDSLLFFYPFLSSLLTSAPSDSHLLNENILIALVWVPIGQSYLTPQFYHRCSLLLYLTNPFENQLQETRQNTLDGVRGSGHGKSLKISGKYIVQWRKRTAS